MLFTSGFEPPDLPALTTQSFLETRGLAGSHWLSMSFLPRSTSAIKTLTGRESVGRRVQLLTLHRMEVGYPPLLTHSQEAVGLCAKCMIIQQMRDKIIKSYQTDMLLNQHKSVL